jgi:hypothetical protein
MVRYLAHKTSTAENTIAIAKSCAPTIEKNASNSGAFTSTPKHQVRGEPDDIHLHYMAGLRVRTETGLLSLPLVSLWGARNVV